MYNQQDCDCSPPQVSCSSKPASKPILERVLNLENSLQTMAKAYEEVLARLQRIDNAIGI
jgi:hypothetical protein